MSTDRQLGALDESQYPSDEGTIDSAGDLRAIIAELQGKTERTTELLRQLLGRGVFNDPKDREPLSVSVGADSPFSADPAVSAGGQVLTADGKETVLASYKVPLGRRADIIAANAFSRVTTALGAGQAVAIFVRKTSAKGKQVVFNTQTGFATAGGTTITVSQGLTYMLEGEMLELVGILQAGAGVIRSNGTIQGIEYNQ